MKKLIYCMGALVASLSLSVMPKKITTFAVEEIETTCKSAYLCDFESGTPVFSKNEKERLPIASMCKIMTLLLSFEAVDEGNLAYEEMITISDNASGMGGSQVFLQENLQYSVNELMKTVAVCSANDSCVALAERISGNENAFVEKMNARAKELGAENTLFANCTGLPKEPQYSCAKDVSIMFRELIKHEKYFEYSKVWLEEFAHPDGRTTTITNTNKLVRFYDGCDGGKTGFTAQAGFCLATTAKRGDTRLVSVVIGSDTSKNRFNSAKNMLNFAFHGYETKKIITAQQPIEGVKAKIKGGKQSETSIFPKENLCVFSQKGNQEDLHVEYFLDELRAPVQMGQRVGEAVLYKNGKEIARTALCSSDEIGKKSWWESVQEGAKHWN